MSTFHYFGNLQEGGWGWDADTFGSEGCPG
jgi:hypothetical protein